MSAQRQGLSMVSTISHQGLVRLAFLEQAMNRNLMMDFMEKLIADNRQKSFLILDNLKVHHAQVVTAWLDERKSKIEVFYLPSYKEG